MSEAIEAGARPVRPAQRGVLLCCAI